MITHNGQVLRGDTRLAAGEAGATLPVDDPAELLSGATPQRLVVTDGDGNGALTEPDDLGLAQTGTDNAFNGHITLAHTKNVRWATADGEYVEVRAPASGVLGNVVIEWPDAGGIVATRTPVGTVAALEALAGKFTGMQGLATDAAGLDGPVVPCWWTGAAWVTATGAVLTD